MKKILLIDDSMIQQRMMYIMLKDEYEVITAESGIEGIQQAKLRQPDLILLDYDMPMMDGKETFAKLLANEETKDIPVIFLTGVIDKKQVAEVLMLRPKGYLVKPVEKGRLIETIESTLQEVANL